MKSTILNIFKLGLSLLFIFMSLNIQAGNSPRVLGSMPYSYEVVAGQQMTIQSVSEKRIKVMGKEYSIGAITLVIGKHGERLSVAALEKGMVVKIAFDDKQRFLNRPTLSRIYID